MGARTRANWHLDLPVDDRDPFQNVEDIGTQLDLTADLDKIQNELKRTLEVESTLHNEGVHCAIKDDPHACCSACSVQHYGLDDPMTPLCALGLEQERLTTQAAIARTGAL